MITAGAAAPRLPALLSRAAPRAAPLSALPAVREAARSWKSVLKVQAGADSQRKRPTLSATGSRENTLDDHLACEPSKRHDALAANRGRRELARALRRPQRRLACSRRLICGLRRRRRRRGCRRSRRQRAARQRRPRRGRQRRRGRERRRRRRWQGRSGTAWLHVSGSGSQQPRSRLGPKLRHLHSNVVCAQQLRRHQVFELAHARFQLFAAAKRPRRLVLRGAAAQTA